MEPIWHENVLARYFSLDIICSSMLPFLLGYTLGKLFNSLEQIVPVDKYPSIFFEPNGGYIV